MLKERYNELATQVVDAFFQVHHELGPGLLESAYEYALLKEFELRGIMAQNQVQIISYLKLSQKKLGFLVNFHVPLIKEGIKRCVNDL